MIVELSGGPYDQELLEIQDSDHEIHVREFVQHTGRIMAGRYRPLKPTPERVATAPTSPPKWGFQGWKDDGEVLAP